jgi:hypothetical protein
MYLNRITLIGLIGSDAERKAANATNGRYTPRPPSTTASDSANGIGNAASPIL